MNHEAFTWVRPLSTALLSQHASWWEADSAVKWLPSTWMNYHILNLRALAGMHAYLPLALDLNDKAANDHPSLWKSDQSKTSAAQQWQGSGKGERVPHLWHWAIWLITPSYKWPLISAQLQSCDKQTLNSATCFHWSAPKTAQCCNNQWSVRFFYAKQQPADCVPAPGYSLSTSRQAAPLATRARSAGSSKYSFAGCRVRLVPSLSEAWCSLGPLWYR